MFGLPSLLSLLDSSAGGTKGRTTMEVMRPPATADCIRVLCLGAWAEKWRTAEWERVFITTAEDIVGGVRG